MTSPDEVMPHDRAALKARPWRRVGSDGDAAMAPCSHQRFADWADSAGGATGPGLPGSDDPQQRRFSHVPPALSIRLY
jgi:hypothetical protein